MRDRVAVYGWAVHWPGRDSAELPGSPEEAACSADEARLVLGRRGLLGKEPSTRLALCATQRALGLAPGPLSESFANGPGTAVVVASNLGNVGTVCAVLDTMRAHGAASVSPLEAPNASSNIIASSIAIRFGCTGPNVTVCSGATAGLDAIRLAMLMLLSGRAARAVVVGVEPGDDVARALAALGEPTTAALREAAACVLLGTPGGWPGRSGLPLGPVLHAKAPVVFPETYGAAGVVGLAVAAARLASTSASCLTINVGCGDAVDGWRSVELSAAGSVMPS